MVRLSPPLFCSTTDVFASNPLTLTLILPWPDVGWPELPPHPAINATIHSANAQAHINE
jgi:hypothetical protein